MLFVTTLDIIPGKAKDAIKLAKKVEPPEGVRMRESLAMFGKPDCLLVFEAPDEKTATEFVLQFDPVAVMKTSVAAPIAELF